MLVGIIAAEKIVVYSGIEGSAQEQRIKSLRFLLKDLLNSPQLPAWAQPSLVPASGQETPLERQGKLDMLLPRLGWEAAERKVADMTALVAGIGTQKIRVGEALEVDSLNTGAHFARMEQKRLQAGSIENRAS